MISEATRKQHQSAYHSSNVSTIPFVHISSRTPGRRSSHQHFELGFRSKRKKWATVCPPRHRPPSRNAVPGNLPFSRPIYSPAPPPYPPHSPHSPGPLSPTRTLTSFQPIYPPPGEMSIGRMSEPDDAFQQNDTRTEGNGGEGSSGRSSPAPFESVTLNDDDDEEVTITGGMGGKGLRPATAGFMGSGGGKRNSWAYGSSGQSNGHGGGGRLSSSSIHEHHGQSDIQRPASEARARPKSFLQRTFSAGKPNSASTSNTAPSPTSHDPPGRTSNISTSRSSTSTHHPIPTTTSSSVPRIHAPPAIPHSANPAVMAALTSNLHPSYSASSSSLAAPSESKRTSFALLSGQALKDVFHTQINGLGKAKGKGKDLGPAKIEQVRSQTRMVHLPPKSKEEDEAHLENWKHMMEESKAAGKPKIASRLNYR